MIITQNDVNNDLRMLVESIEGESRPLVNPYQALKLSVIWPLSCIAGYLLVVFWQIYNFQPKLDNFDNMTTLTGENGFMLAATALSIVFSLFIAAALYGPALAYLSISDEVKGKSIIITRLKTLLIKLCLITFSINLIVAIAAVKIPQLLAVSPAVIMISFLVMQVILSAEVSRYGIGLVISKLNKLVRKI